MNTDRPIRILFVENAPHDVDLAVQAISKEGLSFDFERVDTEAGFLDALERYRPDLVVAGYAPPGFDGLRALELSRAKGPELPVIVLSTGIDAEGAVACIKRGAADYVPRERIARLPPAINAALARREVTRRRDAERQTLRASEERLARIFQVAPTGISVVANRTIMDVNDAFCRMVGYAREELVGRDVDLLYPTREEYDHVGEEGYRRLAETGSGMVETRWRRKDGSIIEAIIALTALDPANPSQGVTLTALDITERKTAENKVRETAHFLQNLIDGIPNPIYFRNTEGIYRGCNRAFEAHAGLPRDQIIGQSVFGVAPKEQAERYQRSDRALLSRGGDRGLRGAGGQGRRKHPGHDRQQGDAHERGRQPGRPGRCVNRHHRPKGGRTGVAVQEPHPHHAAGGVTGRHPGGGRERDDRLMQPPLPRHVVHPLGADRKRGRRARHALRGRPDDRSGPLPGGSEAPPPRQAGGAPG